MNALITRAVSKAFAIAGLAFFAGSVLASDGGMARGNLSIEIDGPPDQVAITQAYLVSGPDSLDAAKITRRIIFSAADMRPAIEACADANCALYFSQERVWVSLDDEAMMSWHAQINDKQASGMTSRAGLVLTTDKPDRVAGTLKLDMMGVKANIEFDAPLVTQSSPAE